MFPALGYLFLAATLIDSYNAGSLNDEAFFKRLVEFAKSLNEEERRGVGNDLMPFDDPRIWPNHMALV